MKRETNQNFPLRARQQTKLSPQKAAVSYLYILHICPAGKKTAEAEKYSPSQTWTTGNREELLPSKSAG
jgi:hypothetical protein